MSEPNNAHIVIDACVLVEAAVSDILLRLAEDQGIFKIRWSRSIWEETLSTWTGKLGWPHAVAESRMRAAWSAFPEAMVETFEPWIAHCTNHPKDRHVLAVAIACRPSRIATFNTNDFPDSSCESWNISVVHPDRLLCDLWDQAPVTVSRVLEAMARDTRRGIPDILGRLAWALPDFAKLIGKDSSIEIPVIQPVVWKEQRAR